MNDFDFKKVWCPVNHYWCYGESCAAMHKHEPGEFFSEYVGGKQRVSDITVYECRMTGLRIQRIGDGEQRRVD